MLVESLLALAAAGATTIITAAATDAWNSTKTAVTNLLGRDESQADAIEKRLERTRQELSSLEGAALQRAREAHATAWRIRFEDLLEERPSTADEVRALVQQILGQVPTSQSAGTVNQKVTAKDNAQVAVQGHGAQTNTFNEPQG